MIIPHAMTLELTPDVMKALSQNLEHSDVLTTLTSYGTVPIHRQGSLIRSLASAPEGPRRTTADHVALLEDVFAKIEQDEAFAVSETPAGA